MIGTKRKAQNERQPHTSHPWASASPMPGTGTEVLIPLLKDGHSHKLPH